MNEYKYLQTHHVVFVKMTVFFGKTLYFYIFPFKFLLPQESLQFLHGKICMYSQMHITYKI